MLPSATKLTWHSFVILSDGLTGIVGHCAVVVFVKDVLPVLAVTDAELSALFTLVSKVSVPEVGNEAVARAAKVPMVYVFVPFVVGLMGNVSVTTTLLSGPNPVLVTEPL